MKRPKAILKPFTKKPQPEGEGLWNFYIGELEAGQCLLWEDELETLATAGILIDKGLVESPERAFLKKLNSRISADPSDNWQTRLDRDLEKELEKLLELEQA